VSESVAFVGLGHMGSHMCRNVCTARFAVSAFDLDRAAVRRAVRSGARGTDILADCLSGA
jgi:3-hydroxyisobutyrate dehydrogenase-like beta-hydroxyacid dehydrogenase